MIHRTRRTWRGPAASITLATATAAALLMPATAHAEPAAPEVPPTTGQNTLPEIPGDAELADIVRTLKDSGASEIASEALTSILSADGQLDLSSYLGSSSLLDGIGLDSSNLSQLGLSALGLLGSGDQQTPAAPGSNPAAPGSAPAAPGANPVSASADDVVDTLQKASGTSLLTPAFAPLCVDPTADNPLGLATAPAIAVPGPWPTVRSGQDEIQKALNALLPDDQGLRTAIDTDHTAFALVPPADSGADNFRVAWFNASTLQGGFADLRPLSESVAAGPLKQLLSDTESFHGVRLARVKTGKGTILAAVFGTTTKAGRTCFFLPALGTVKN